MMKLYNKAIREINKQGMLLVFPIKGQPAPLSLWSELHPGSVMNWVWEEDGDNRVMELWHLMKQLSESGEVVYSKWYQDRATFFSLPIFKAYLCVVMSRYNLKVDLTDEAKMILASLKQDSPLSTRELKDICDLKGRFFESTYNRGIKQLYRRGLVVGYGEKNDSSFPSSMIGATELLFEDLYKEALEMDVSVAAQQLNALSKSSPQFASQIQRLQKRWKSK